MFWFFFLFISLFHHPLQAVGEVTGTVTDFTTSLPISGAVVEAIRGNEVRYSDTTAGDGTYALFDMDPGNYNLVFSASGYQTQAIGVKVKNNQVEIVDLALTPTGGTISGTVTDASTTNPIVGAPIYVFQNTILIASTSTDAGGMYTFNDLAPGTYVVLATATDHQEQALGATVIAGMTVTNDFALEPAPGAISGQVTDALTSDPIQDAQIRVFSDSILVGFANSDINGNYTISGLVPGGYIVIASSVNYRFQSIGAEVFSNMTTPVNIALTPPPGTIAGRVIDANTSDPIPGARIAIFQNQVFIMSVLTDINGDYEASELAPGDYFVVAQANDYQSSVSEASVQASNITTLNFSLSLNPGFISGTITDAISTDPIPGARILIFSGSQLITSEVSAENGTYTIPNLAPGDYIVLVRADSYQASFSSETVMTGATTTVDFTMDPNPGSVTGLISSQCNDSPIQGALITVADGSTIVGFTLTDSNGNYTIGNLAPGDYTIRAFHQNFLATSSPVTIQSDTATPVNLSLVPKALPPETLGGTIIKNRFLLQQDRIHSIFWTASQESCVIGYEILRNGTVIDFVSASAPLTYMDHNRPSQDTYTVRAVNSFGQTSSGVSIQLPP